jgi:cyclic pyranopterin phosphate synthase
MPREIEKVPMESLLTYEEILTVVKAAVKLGINHYRITGGEPLMRRDCSQLIGQLKHIKGVETVTMTTNGVVLENYVQQLKKAGLDGVNISLDTLDEKEFETITGRNQLHAVLKGIDTALDSKISVKINTVTRKNTDWEMLLSYAEAKNVPVRFIEMMPIGYGKQYVGVANDELLSKIESKYGKAQKEKESMGNGPAVYYRFAGYKNSIGFISAMNHKFCDSCNRIRLSSQGYLKLCLCYDQGVDLREILRNDESQKYGISLTDAIEDAIYHKEKEHCFDQDLEITEQKKMVQIGG